MCTSFTLRPPVESTLQAVSGREGRTSQWQIFDVHNGLMSAFDRDIEGGWGEGGSGVTLCALAWPRGFCCHSWWQWLSPCRLNWCLQICPGCTFFPLLGSTSWWWVADETERFPTLTLELPSRSLEWLTRRSGTVLPRSAFFPLRERYSITGYLRSREAPTLTRCLACIWEF